MRLVPETATTVHVHTQETSMDPQEIKEIIIKELPSILKDDSEMREFVLRLTEGRYPSKEDFESRFDRILEQLRLDREEDRKRWEENRRQWTENQKRWDENQRKWDENQKQWQKNQETIDGVLQSIKALDQRFLSTIGALGARWGLYSEHSYRNALKGILEEHFDIEVINITDFDDQGEVFGRPDQVELDIIIKDGVLIICEIKSSMSKSDMHIFERKARFYERKHNRKANQLIVISPMVDQRAEALAEKLGITVYSYPEKVEPQIFSP